MIFQAVASPHLLNASSVQSLSRVWLCDLMNCSTPGLPVHHQLPEFTQTHIHRVSDAIQPSHPPLSPSPPAPNPSQHQSLFQWVSSSHEVANWEKNPNFATKVQYPTSDSGCVPSVHKIFPETPRLTGSLLERKRDGPDVSMLVSLSLWVWGPSLWSHSQGNCYWKMTSVQAFWSSVWLSTHRILGKVCCCKKSKASRNSVYHASIY